MCCRDLSPFSIVEKPGFRAFLLQTGVIRDLDDLPTPEAVSRGGLDNVYETTLDAVKQLIETSQGIVAITTDMWTDNYRRRSYIAFTLHFCNKEYELQSLTLKTVLFEGAHTGENIKREMEATAKEFGLDSKKTIYVTDNGSNIVKACNLAKVERLGCIAHGVHNLITVDGILKTNEIKAVVDSVKDIVKTFVYKSSLLEEEGRNMVQERLISEIGNEDVDVEVIEYGDSTESSDDLPGASSAIGQYTTTLKRDCPTRWNSLLNMLQSLLKSRELVERCLTRLRMFEKIPTLEQWQTIEDLVNFLLVFKKATELLSGSAYTTSSIALLFRAELVSALQVSSTDGKVLKDFKKFVLNIHALSCKNFLQYIIIQNLILSG